MEAMEQPSDLPSTRLHLRYYGIFRQRLDRGDEEAELPIEVSTAGELVDWLRDKELCLVDLRPSAFNVALDGKIVSHAHPIAGASTAAVFPAMVGG